MDLKEPLNYDQQIKRLCDHSITVNNAKSSRTALKEIGYYRLSGYAIQYRISENDSNCVDGTNFDDIIRLYSFDKRLRDLLRKYIEIAEVYARSVIAYNFATRNCMEPPHDQHYDPAMFSNQKGHKEVLDSFSKKKSYYKDSPIMKHHVSYYGGKLPIWAITEMISFSELSKLYSCMKPVDQDSIALDFHTGKAILRNNLHCLSVLRNKCAHAARLYNTVNTPPVKFNKLILRKFPQLREDTLFAFIIALIQSLPRHSEKEQLRKSLLQLFKTYDDVIEKKYIGLCEDYETILSYVVNK